MINTICIAGKNRIAISTLQHALTHYAGTHRIIAVANLDDSGVDQWQPSYRKFVGEVSGVELCALEQAEKIENLLFLSTEFDRIIRPNNFSSSACLVNIHFSALPAYKGVYTSAHPILNGESSVGCTLHEIDVGIDTGPIIAQRTFTLGANDTAKTLYAKYMDHSEILIEENFQSLLDGTFTSRPQPSGGSTYYSRKSIDYRSIHIDLNKTADEIRRQIHAFNHRSFQLPTVLGHTIATARILESRTRNKPGTILDQSDSVIKIATVDYDCALVLDAFPALIEAVLAEQDADILRIVAANPLFLEESCSRGWTPLMVAAYNNKLHSIETLLKLGADPNHASHKRTTPLMYAKNAFIASGDPEILRSLKQAGADPAARDIRGLTLFDYVTPEQAAAIRDVLAMS